MSSSPVFKAPRSLPAIQQEYTNLAANAGQIQYQIYTLKKDLEGVNNALRDLNAEAFSAKQAEEEAKKAAAASEPAPTLKAVEDSSNG